MTEIEFEGLIGRRAICDYMGVSVSTFYKLVESAGFPAERRQNTWVANRVQINVWCWNNEYKKKLDPLKEGITPDKNS